MLVPLSSDIRQVQDWAAKDPLLNLGLELVCRLVSEFSTLFGPQCHLWSKSKDVLNPMYLWLLVPNAVIHSLSRLHATSGSPLGVAVLFYPGALGWDLLLPLISGNAMLSWDDFLARIVLFFGSPLPTKPLTYSLCWWHCVEGRQAINIEWDHILGMQWLQHKASKKRHG